MYHSWFCYAVPRGPFFDNETYFQISMDGILLLKELVTSPIGSIAINDFRREQFVLCNDGLTLKLSDLDDASIFEPFCTSSQDCAQGYCNNEKCVGFNEAKNLHLMFEQILKFLSARDTPEFLKHAVENFVSNRKRHGIDSSILYDSLLKIVRLYCQNVRNFVKVCKVYA